MKLPAADVRAVDAGHGHPLLIAPVWARGLVVPIRPADGAMAFLPSLLPSPQTPQTQYAPARCGLPADAQPGSTSTGFQRRTQAAMNLQAPLAQPPPGRAWLCALGAETPTAEAFPTGGLGLDRDLEASRAPDLAPFGPSLAASDAEPSGLSALVFGFAGHGRHPSRGCPV